MKAYFLRYMTIGALRVAGIATLCHFVYKFSPSHFWIILGCLVVQEVLTYMNLNYRKNQQKQTYLVATDFIDEFDLKKENWN